MDRMDSGDALPFRGAGGYERHPSAGQWWLDHCGYNVAVQQINLSGAALCATPP
jgi:hypothetical protein